MNANKQTLRVGDRVLWSPFGSKESYEAVVCGIEVGCDGDKYGTALNQVSWDEVHEPGNCVVNLANGRWAYGYQIKPVEVQ
jgi:hypothetical protein